LFQIDASPYQGHTTTAPRPAWRKAEANLMQASAQAQRYKPLVEAQSHQPAGISSHAQAAQNAGCKPMSPLGKAAVQTARINLNYANVTRADFRAHWPLRW
jgi:membrane fusion protein (multidrug efflux system)